MYTAFRRRRVLGSLLLLVFAGPVAAPQEHKIEIQDLISRHLEAIGTATAREAVKSRFGAGTVKFIGRIGRTGSFDGSIGLVSLNPKIRYSVKFPTVDYPGEQLAYDGKKVDVGWLPAGRRSELSLFIQQQDLPFKEGLFGGVLSNSWPLMKSPLAARLVYKVTR